MSEVVRGNMDTVGLNPAQLVQAMHDPFGWSAATWYSQRGFEFVPPTVDVPVLLVRAREENPLLNVESVPETTAHALGWERFAPSLTVVDVDGTHFSMVHDPHWINKGCFASKRSRCDKMTHSRPRSWSKTIRD